MQTNNAAFARIIVMCGLAVCGCTSVDSLVVRPAPVQERPIAIRPSGDPLNVQTEAPLGAYRIPDSRVVVTGHQTREGVGVAQGFALLGAAAYDTTATQIAYRRVQNVEDRLRVKLDPYVARSVDEALTSGDLKGRFSQEQSASGPMLYLNPTLYMTFVDDERILPFVVLKPVLYGADGRPIWFNRYAIAATQARPLTGPGGWTEKENAELDLALRAIIPEAVRRTLRDVSRPFPRGEQDLVTLQSHVPYEQYRLQMTGMRLNEDDRYIMFVPKMSHMCFPGIMILDKRATVTRPVNERDRDLLFRPLVVQDDAKP
jgi:hypothetical protein